MKKGIRNRSRSEVFSECPTIFRSGCSFDIGYDGWIIFGSLSAVANAASVSSNQR
jgi:hypothetical protein